MKKIIILAISLCVYYVDVEAQLRMDSDGDVVIGNYAGDPTYDLEVRGQAYFSCVPANSGIYFTNYSTIAAIKPQWNNSARVGLSSNKFYYVYTNWLYYDNLYDWSDISIKENIRDIESPLSSICKIRGIKYDRKREYYVNSPEENMEEIIATGKNKYGVIAQELQEIFPDLVKYNEEAELFAVDYIGLVPILIEAIKEQQLAISSLQSQIIQISNEVPALKGTSDATNTENNISDNVNILFQNSPNPFSEETKIEYLLNENVSKATLFIYNMTGKQLKGYELHHNENTLSIMSGELDPGIYFYTMIVDGNVVGTKQMILTD